MRRFFNKRVLLVVVLVIALLISGFVVWAAIPAGALMPEAQAALVGDEQVTVSAERWLIFSPANAEATTGLILYPGGRVQPEAYAPTAHQLAEAGYLVVIVPMPLHFAIFDVDAAADVIAAYPEIEHWAVGGHSLGGAMAANYVASTLKSPNAETASSVDGLVLWASYPQASDSLAAFDHLVVTSIYGTLDGLATIEKIDASRPYLPDDTQFSAIEGGNHAQFGWYGDQGGDNPAAISRDSQAEQIYRATLAALEKIERSQ